MSLPFSMSGIGSLLVNDDGYDGFDRPSFAQLVSRLGTGTSVGDQILQTGSLPFRQATVAGVSYVAADVIALRALNDSKDIVTFTDGDGYSYTVVVLDFSARATTGRWLWSMVLAEMDVEGS